MTAVENMSFALRLKRASQSKIDEKTERAVKILGSDQLLGRYPRQLGGQRQRVAIDPAIVRGPQVASMIIEAHGGRLWATANVPRGAVFQFTVPTRSGAS
jgi:ABC-type Fe3+/spermidine/putrescine transport system ATPase subunit